MKIYIGDIKNLYYVKKNDSDGEITEINTNSVVVVKDALFYYNFLGVPVSLDYDTFLPTYSEAKQYIVDSCRCNPSSVNGKSCLYVSYDNLDSQEISKQQFRKIKKAYKSQRQKNR